MIYIRNLSISNDDRKGNVMIVGNIEKNELLESAGYPDGFGKLQCLTLNDRFEGIFTYQDLIKAYRENQKLIFLNAQGQRAQIQNFKILKLL